MAVPELLHSAPQFLHSTEGLRQALPEPHQLLDTLRSLGHPYGLLLAQPNSSRESAESSIQNDSLLPLSERSVVSGEISKDPKANNDIRDLLSSFLWWNVSSSSAPAIASTPLVIWSMVTPSEGIIVSGEAIGQKLRDNNKIRELIGDNEETATYLGTAIASSITILPPLSLSHVIAPSYVETKHNKAQAKDIPLALVIPLSGKTVREKPLLNRPQEIYVTEHGVIFGSASLKLSTYRSPEPFTIKTPDGQPVTEIQPRDPLAALHVSHQAARFRGLSPLEKARAMVTDVTQLLTAIDQTDPQTLNPDQQATLATAKDATIIGISHLVRLFRRQTGLPTWKLDVLPELLQRFHALDSQAVSAQFGGRRRVKPNDIEMLVITPTQRRQLLTSLKS